MPITLPDVPARQYRSAEEVGTSGAQRLGAQFASAWEDNPIPLLYRWSELRKANARGTRLSKEDAERLGIERGATLDVSKDGATPAALELMIQNALRRQARESVIQRGPQGAGIGAVGFGTEIAAGLLDPIGFGLNFIPVVGQSTKLGMMANSARLGTRAAGRIAVGAIEGTVGQAMVEPLTGFVYRQEGRSYGALDAARNIAMGATFGTAAHLGLGFGGDAYRALRGQAQPWALPGTTPIPPDVPTSVDAPASALDGQGAAYGGSTRIKVGDTYQPARWAIVDADEFGGTMEKGDNQFRDRTRAASGDQIQAIAREIDFEYLHAHPDMASGAPTLSREGQIIGGNGRAAAISMAYDLPSGKAYSGPLRERIEQFGVRADQVAGMKKPMLVRVLQEDVNVREAAIASNETGTLRMSALEQSKVDGERLGRVDLVAGPDGRLDMAENRGAVRRWVEQFPESERAALMDAQGNLSAEGARRLQNAALHNAFGDTPLLARLVDSKDPGMGRVTSALIRSSGKIAEVRAAASRGELHNVDLGPDIVAAVERLAWLREQGIGVETYLRQGDLLGDGLSAPARSLLAFLGRNLDSSRRMSEGIVKFYEGIEAAGNPSQADIFAGESTPPDLGELLNRSLAEAENDVTTAEAKMERVSPATREAAMGVASAQLLEGKNIDVQALVDMDPAIGQATMDDVTAAARRQDSPEAFRTADPEASRIVQEREAMAPKTWGSETAKAERQRAQADLEILAKAQDDAWKYARGADDAMDAPAMLERVDQAVRESFGDESARLLDAGRVSVVATVDDLPDGPHPIDVTGMTAPDGRVYIVASNVSPDRIPGLILHEVGVHVGMPAMLGDKGFQDVLGQVDALLRSGDAVALKARSAVPVDTPSHLVREETLAYLIENHPTVGFVRDLLAKIKAWAYKTFPGLRGSMVLEGPELVRLAKAAIRSVSDGIGEGRLSRALEDLPERLDIDGVQRPTRNSAGQPLARTEEGVRNFWKWFGDSRVVDEAGNPLVVYHGTAGDITQFRLGVGGRGGRADTSGVVFFADSPQQAGFFADMRSRRIGEGAQLTPVHLEIKNPAILDWKGGEKDGARSAEFISRAKKSGHDGVIYTNVRDAMGLKPAAVYVAFDPTQIKSATGNRGTFDPKNPDIRYSRGEVQTLSPKDELAPFAEAEAKAEKYAISVKAAAERWGSDEEMRAAISQASGGEIVGREVEDLIAQLKARHREVVTGLRKMAAGAQAEDIAASLQDAAMTAADQMAEAAVRAAAVEHRNAALSLAARTRALSYVRSQFKGREIEGLKAVVAGTERLREAGRASAALEIKQFESGWMAGLENDLRKAGAWDLFIHDAYPEDVARALWQHSLDQPDFSGIHPDAVKIADIVTRYQSDARHVQNRFGAWIGDLSGWMYRQAHDMHRMRKAGDKAWKDFVRTRLDWDRIVEQLGIEDVTTFNREQFLDAAWLDLSNGQHFKPESFTEIKAAVGPGNLGRKVSQARALHWIDSDSALAYLQEFGPANGSLAQTVLGGFSGAARAAGLMKVLGPNYEANLRAVSDQLQHDLLGTKQGDTWRARSNEVLDLLHHVDGSLSIPHDQLAAKIGGGLRAWQSMAKLGAAVVSQVSDVPVYAASIAHRFDTGLLPGMRDAIGGLLQGRPKAERLEILHECGYFFESVSRQAFARFDVSNDIPGAMTTAMEKFFQWGGITWWTETLRSSAVLTVSRRLGDFHGKAWGALPESTRDMLGQYRIDAPRWDLLTMASTREVDGNVYLTAEGVRAIPDPALSDYLARTGRQVNDAAVANLRADLESSVRSMFLDQGEYAVIEPTARTRQTTLRGTQRGTLSGEILRSFMQFKSFPFAYLERVFGREIYGRGYDSLGQYAKAVVPVFGKDQKAMGSMLSLMVALTASGYLAMTAKDLLKLRKPKPVDDWRTWAAAFMQGGSLGIYGDFLFGQLSRFGSGAVETLAGPVPSAIFGSQGLYSLLSDTIWGSAGKALEGEDVEPSDIGARWLRYAEANTPFINLHLLRPALNALLFWRLEEALNPGSLRRMERRMSRNGQEYIVPPSQLVR